MIAEKTKASQHVSQRAAPQSQRLIVAVVAFALLALFAFAAWLAWPWFATPRVQVIKLGVANCTDCYEPLQWLAELRARNVSFEASEFDAFSEKGQDLIKRYGVKKVPTFLVIGHLSDETKAWLSTYGEFVGGGFVFTRITPVYYDVEAKAFRGRVNAVLLTEPRCERCFDTAPLLAHLRNAGVVLASIRAVNASSAEGAQIIKAYNITRAPTLILDKEIAVYPGVYSTLLGIASNESDGSLVTRALSPPYWDYQHNATIGIVNIVYLVDETCKSCYNATIHKKYLAEYGLVFGNETFFDVSSYEGYVLIRNYNITTVPTALLSPSAVLYPRLRSVWPQLGTIESDGWLVFRNMNALPNVTYREIVLNQST